MAASRESKVRERSTIMFVIMLLLTELLLTQADTCLGGQYNLTVLQSFSPWYTVSESTGAIIKLSLCDKLPLNTTTGAQNCPDGTSVCLLFQNGTTISYGNFSASQSLQVAADSNLGSKEDLLYVLKGQQCGTNSSEFFSTIFHFRCGKTLGHPYYIRDSACSLEIDWASYIFCHKLPAPEKEVPCTIVKNGNLIDLSPLIKLSGGYMVDEDDTIDRRLYINVCRDITAATDGTQNCPKGVGSCKVVGNNTVDFGKPSMGLEATASGVRLVYTSTEKPAGCLDMPTTTINFNCPQRGGSKDPVLLSRFLVACSMEIEWVTEYACPVNNITSLTCQLTMEQHSINFDLSLLKSEQPYQVNATDGSDEYLYLINVCGKISCGNDKSSVCQTKIQDENFFRKVGDSDHMKLRYSDGRLIMVMTGGDACSSHYHRETIIEFFCNQSAVNDGKGYPQFIEHSNCSYFFRWETKLACQETLLGDTCSISVDGRRFDLSPLVRSEGTNWEVITGEEDNTYFFNVCHDVLNTGEASQCPPGSAICRIDKQNKVGVNLGRHKQSLQYDKVSKSLQLVYTGGETIVLATSTCQATTVVSFFCAPGQLDQSPRLVVKSQDDCYHEIEWHTPAACPLSHKTGLDCKVFDSDAGFEFDLNPLTTNGSYTASSPDGYVYLINVCDSIKYNNYCTTPPHNNAAVCQVKIGSATSPQQIKIAEPTSKLEYFNGVLNLTYTNGEPYNNPAHTPRSAQFAFICDLAAGLGKPEFLEERNYTYAFLWRSNLACPVPPEECVVIDEVNHLQYDLSSLTRSSRNWQIESLEDSKKRFYINVCAPVRPVAGVNCSPFTSVCVTNVENGTETLFHGNLGRSESAPVIETSIHGLKLVYTNGGTCQDGSGVTKRFQTTIHFSCEPNKVVEGPKPVEKINQCEYSILWETAAACPITKTKSETEMCHIKDPSTDFVFNLMPLFKKEGYFVETKDHARSFKVSLCGALEDTACGKFDSSYPTTVCEIGHNGSTPLARLGSDMTYVSQGDITLTYTGHKSKELLGSLDQFIFHFVCDRTAREPEVMFDRQSSLATVFRVRTALACSPRLVSCIAQDAQGRQYDLTSLARETGNWRVIDNRPTHSDLTYYINVCRPVNPTPEVTCPGGAVGGCQIGSSGNFSMGYIQSEPLVSSDGVITIHYQGGDKCHVGKDKESFRSTRINFICDSVEHDPVFEGESDTCEYSFIWRTPSACPYQVTTGSDCKVIDPLYNNEFSLSPLRLGSSNYNVSGRGYTFLLNVCGPLVNGPGFCGKGQISACRVGAPPGSEAVAIGATSDAPVYSSGQISLAYLADGEGHCHKFRTIINFLCDHSKTGNTQPQYVDELSDCTYVFEWHTSIACPPRQIADCTYRHGDDVFDLSRLTRFDRNYERFYNESHLLYIINICRSLIHVKDQTCPFNAAACMIDLAQTDAKKKFHNMGEVLYQSISYEKGTLVLRYGNGELCADGKSRRSTVIIFQCNANSDELGTPGGRFVMNENECEDHFYWTSSAACPLKKEAEENTTDFGNCRVANPNTGYVYDLSDLKSDKGYKAFDREGHEFILNICAGLGSSGLCKNGSGSCQSPVSQDIASSVNTGNANARLQYHSGVLMLNYSGGDTCLVNQVSRTTIINFICAPGIGDGVPVFIDQSDDCLYYFDWQTQRACEKEVPCEVTTDARITLDLSPLVKKSGKYNVLLSSKDPVKGNIYINLCRPLNPIYGVLCPAGSGACLVGSGPKPLSLGRVDQGLQWDSALKQVKLIYTNGDPCPSNAKANMSSVIILKCGAEEQEPHLESVSSDCQYLFLWETPLACSQAKPQQLTSNCTFYDYTTRKKYDFSSLSDEEKVVTSHEGNFRLRICGNLVDKGKTGAASCSKSSVCLTGSNSRAGSYGSSSQGMFRKDSAFVVLDFSDGRACSSGSGKATSSIYFECDSSAGTGVPLLLDEEECEVIFRWKTSLVCPVDRMECVVTRGLAKYDLTFLSQDSSSWNMTDQNKNVYWLNLCQAVHGSAAVVAGCPSTAAVCRKTADGKVQMLGKVDTQTILVGEGQPPVITVQYTEGDVSACNAGRRRRSDLVPTVLVTLMCGDDVGHPTFHQHRINETTNSCVFEFQWKTKMACDVGLKDWPVAELSGVIIDPRTKYPINLRALIALNDIEVNAGDTKYLINIGGPINREPNMSECVGASVCLVPLNSLQPIRNLGNYSSRAYYIRDEQLQLVLTTNQKCPSSRSQKNVSTTITFICDPMEALKRPDFLYLTSDCNYIFNWETSLLCTSSQDTLDLPTLKPESANSKAKGESMSGTRVAVGVVVLCSVLVAAILALVLHKPERRAIIWSKMKSTFLCRKTNENPILYSRLSQSEHEDSLVNGFRDPFNPFNETDDESEINNSQLPVRPPTYRDDSDEDMLL